MLDDIKKTLWATADKLRANMDAAEYKHLVLGLIFVKYISDNYVLAAFEGVARAIYANLYSQQAQTLATLRDTLLPPSRASRSPRQRNEPGGR